MSIILEEDYGVKKTILGGLSPLSLCCAHCQEGGGLHHDIVNVFTRNEDANNTIVTTVCASTSVKTMPSVACGNPSSRRDGLTVEFWCEHCEGRSMLYIAQHKGYTEMDMLKIEENTNE